MRKRTTPSLSVMIVDAEPTRSRHLRAAFTVSGFQVVAEVRSAFELPDAVERSRPDVIIIAADSPDRDTLEHVCLVTRDTPRPVVMFTGDDNPEQIRAAVSAGVSAYIVDGLDMDRIRPVVEVACAQFEQHQALREKLGEAERKLAERTLIERAKGVLMDAKGLSEEEAHGEMRTLAMSSGRRLADVAQRILDLPRALL